MSCMKNELHEKWAARISIKNFTRNEIARTSEFLPPLCIVKCQQKEKKEEQISEWNLFSTTQDSSQLYLLEDLRNRNSLCCNSLHDLRFLPGDLSCIRCSCNSISWLIWHSTPRKIGCTAVIGILCRTAPSYCGILAKLSLPDCALRLESRHQHTRMHASLHHRSLQTIKSGYTRTATQLLTPQYNVNPTLAAQLIHILKRQTFTTTTPRSLHIATWHV